MTVLLASDFDQSRFLKAEVHPPEKKYRNRAVTAEVFENNGKSETKLVLWFTNSEQGFVLNKTNLRTLQGALGDDTTNWIGRVIVVFKTLADMRGKMTAALRVRIPPPKQPQQAAPQQPVANGAAAPAAAAPLVVVPLAAAVPPAAVVADPDLEPDPVLSLQEEMDDEIGF